MIIEQKWIDRFEVKLSLLELLQIQFALDILIEAGNVHEYDKGYAEPLRREIELALVNRTT
jgi:hypothetical protein